MLKPWIVGLFVAVVSMWLVFGMFAPLYFVENQSDRGQLGDQFGVVNSLFSGLAFAAVFAAIFVQGKLHREALQAQGKAITMQLILQITDEIRDSEWGRAHEHLWKYHRHNHKGFHEDFIAREGNPLGREHDRNRRIFIEPCHKVHNLIQASVITDDVARVVLTPDIVLTLLEVVEPLERLIRSNYATGLFEWARALYSRDMLEQQGKHVRDSGPAHAAFE